MTDSEWRPSRSESESDTSALAARSERSPGAAQRTAVWYGPTVQAARNLSQLARNWDRRGAPIIDPVIVSAAMSLLTSVMQDDTPAPSIVPTTRGGIQLEWHTRGIDLELEFLSPVRVQGFFEDQRNGSSWELDLSFNLKPLTDAIASLSSR